MVIEKDTLAYQMIRPGVVHRDLSGVQVPELVQVLKKFMNQSKVGELIGDMDSEPLMVSPEQDALVFYMMNHAVSAIRQKVHPYVSLGRYLPVVEQYHTQLSYCSARMFYYMLLICTRESRHVKNKVDSPFMKKLYEPTKLGIKNFHDMIKGTGSSTAVNTFMSDPPIVDLGRYTDFLVKCFNEGQFTSGYGGKAWGAVAKVLRDYVWGGITAEMMMDTAFTLCHNNGPIFNKGMLYSSYSDEIYMILDVQRSGQIPKLVGNKECSKALNGIVVKLWTLCNDVLKEEFEGYVDWYLVESLGSKKTYPMQKKAQLQKYGEPPKVKAKKLAEVISHKTLVSPDVDADETWIQIMPSAKVKVVKRGN